MTKLTPEQLIKERNKGLINIAEKNGDFDLVRVIQGIKSPWDYLIDYLENTDAGKANISKGKRTLLSTVKANKRRYAQLTKYVKSEIDDKYKEIYEAELALLDKYIYIAIEDILEGKGL